jgi:hypothetical protein
MILAGILAVELTRTDRTGDEPARRESVTIPSVGTSE